LTETEFISKNEGDWKALELLLKSPVKDPDKLTSLFVKVSSDLSYARTFYPNRSVRVYLNGLTEEVFSILDQKKTNFTFASITKFFREVLPYELYHARKAILISFLVFSFSVLIGVLSTIEDESFTRLILGDGYVELTEKNIDNNDPMAIYKDEKKTSMFLQITANNIKVSFLAFVLGIFGAIGTSIVLIFNGIMLGTFQYFFYQKGLFITSFLTIWIHGTIEISAIIIAGAAGYVLGKGLLFPGTYRRSTSLQLSTKRAIRIIIGNTPLFILAGFLESFVTRLTGLPAIVKIGIILGSLGLVIYYYIVYPMIYVKNNPNQHFDFEPNVPEKLEYEKLQSRTFGANIELSLSMFRKYIATFTKLVILPFLLGLMVIYAARIYLLDINPEYDYLGYKVAYMEVGGLTLLMWLILLFFHGIMVLNVLYENKQFSFSYYKLYLKRAGVITLIFVTIPFVVIYLTGIYWALLLPFIYPATLVFVPSLLQANGELSIKNSIGKCYNYYLGTFPSLFFLVAFHYLMYLLLYTSISNFFIDFLTLHDFFDNGYHTYVFFNSIIFIGMNIFLLPLYYFNMVNYFYSKWCDTEALDLRRKLENFGNFAAA